MKDGGWTAAKPNTISMPLPNLGSILSSIGGITYWNVYSHDFNGRTLGNGTFLVYNASTEFDFLTNINSYYTTTGSYSQLTVLQGMGVTYPSGSFSFTQYSTGATITQAWSTLLLQGDSQAGYMHQGWAIKLSGVTSGGVGGGGGLQPF